MNFTVFRIKHSSKIYYSSIKLAESNLVLGSDIDHLHDKKIEKHFLHGSKNTGFAVRIRIIYDELNSSLI